MRGARAGGRPVDIERDRHGVPHIRASSEADLYLGLGYCHGRDRGMQMALVRVLGQGRASELLRSSGDMLEIDGFFRRVNLVGDVAAEANELSTPDRALAEAYCRGVDQALRRRPLEMRVLGLRPEPWSVADSLLIARVVGYVSMAQTQGDMERLAIELLQRGAPPEHVRALFPGLLDELDISLVKHVELEQRLLPASLLGSEIIPPMVASNSWALAPTKTASGKALLANDPHLEIGHLPPVFYEVVLELADRYCIAATIPGLPGALIGRTNDVAWSATYSSMDAHDSWIEECRDGCYRRVVDGEERWLPFEVRTEVIERKNKPDAILKFYENEHGVLDGDPFRPALRLSSRWSAAAGSGATSLSAILSMPRVADVASGMDALGRVETSWNWVLADRHGAIGYQMSGLLPRRAGGHTGFAPRAGWDPAHDWQGFVPPAELPRLVDPPCGYVATANDDLNHLGRSRPVNLPLGGDRAARIAELLEARNDWTPRDAEMMLMDTFSRQADRYMAVLRPLLPDGGHADVLRTWDLRYDEGSRGAPLFERFYARLVLDVFSPVAGDEVMRYLVEETGIVAAYYANLDRVLLDADSVWLRPQGRDALFARAATAALRGAMPTWGEVHRLQLRNMVLGGRLPAWLGFDVLAGPLRGGRATIHQGQIYRSGGRVATVGPSYRLVVDLGSDEARTCLAGGPSERRTSGWYTTGLADWRAGRFKRLRPAVDGSRRSSPG
jgi:penicillin amidase